MFFMNIFIGCCVCLLSSYISFPSPPKAFSSLIYFLFATLTIYIFHLVSSLIFPNDIWLIFLLFSLSLLDIHTFLFWCFPSMSYSSYAIPPFNYFSLSSSLFVWCLSSPPSSKPFTHYLSIYLPVLSLSLFRLRPNVYHSQTNRAIEVRWWGEVTTRALLHTSHSVCPLTWPFLAQSGQGRSRIRSLFGVLTEMTQFDPTFQRRPRSGCRWPI